jgi:hypothetical protein
VRRSTALVLLCLCMACGKPEPEVDATTASGAAGEPSGARPPGGGDVVSRSALAERSAFDLVAEGAGAILVRGMPVAELAAERLDARGKRLHGVPLVADLGGGRVVEVAAAAGAGRVLVAWVEEGPDGVRARAALGDAGTLVFASPLDLGPASLATTERGHIAAAFVDRVRETSGGGRFVVFHRGDREPCAEAPSGCVQFPLHQVDEAGATPRRVLLSVPAPCGRAVAGFAAAAGRWYYGVCALKDGRAATTVFTIEHAPEYAQAEEVLPGCVPAGMTVLEAEVLLTGQCGRDRRAVRLGRRDAALAPVGLDAIVVRCDGVKAVLVLPGTAARRVTLAPRTGDVAPVLPTYLAPAGSRAVAMGDALLIATGHATELVVRAFACGEGNREP